MVVSALDVATRSAGYEAISREGGGFAMVALDQRGSLEMLFRDAGLDPDQTAMDVFRAAAATALIPEASAILLERGFLSRRYPADPWTGRCGLIVAADELVQPPGKPVETSLLDPAGAELAIQLGAKALKLLVLWRAGREHVEQVELARSFVELAHEKGLVAIVEGIVRGPSEGVRPSAGDLVDAAHSSRSTPTSTRPRSRSMAAVTSPASKR